MNHVGFGLDRVKIINVERLWVNTLMRLGGFNSIWEIYLSTKSLNPISNSASILSSVRHETFDFRHQGTKSSYKSTAATTSNTCSGVYLHTDLFQNAIANQGPNTVIMQVRTNYVCCSAIQLVLTSLGTVGIILPLQSTLIGNAESYFGHTKAPFNEFIVMTHTSTPSAWST